MRRLQTIRMITATVAAVALVVSVAPRAMAHHRPNLNCSESGDLCQSTRKVDAVRKLRIALAARYFTTFHLCVRDPDGYRICAPFRIRERADGTFARSVRWRQHFPSAGPGAYTVSWWVGDQCIGRRPGFHVR